MFHVKQYIIVWASDYPVLNLVFHLRNAQNVSRETKYLYILYTFILYAYIRLCIGSFQKRQNFYIFIFLGLKGYMSVSYEIFFCISCLQNLHFTVSIFVTLSTKIM